MMAMFRMKPNVAPVYHDKKPYVSPRGRNPFGDPYCEIKRWELFRFLRRPWVGMKVGIPLLSITHIEACSYGP